MFEIFLIFLKIGFFTFGGGYAMIPIIEDELTIKKNLLSPDEFVDIISIAQSFPGPIAVNLSLLTGYKIGGYALSALCCIGIVLPSFLSILALSYIYSVGSELWFLKSFFYGVRPVMVALLAYSFTRLFSKMDKCRLNIALFAFSFALVAVFNINPIFVILTGGVFSLCTK
ncbi:chromate transporter [Peptoclostridium litorale DSM 5388]|uniref:Chromate transporter family protein n=1 Tax=Peptoclostridium litorale DSM 5388 TaxID=1121324 RepID=A0A069RC41_PEPLI|nr:chromate transporter [Peptoclostridium litorale]KDR93830.1 chromate transporter family protein [Peptoclostridium litorale DSM 5388]SIN86712.1 chromate transporter [Peptoclostridium litorale DSM 5388]